MNVSGGLGSPLDRHRDGRIEGRRRCARFCVGAHRNLAPNSVRSQLEDIISIVDTVGLRPDQVAAYGSERLVLTLRTCGVLPTKTLGCGLQTNPDRETHR
jgi:hypothetical protein